MPPVDSAPGMSWRPLSLWPRAIRPSLALQHWLTDPGSLTARLIAKSSGHFQVEIIRQRLGRARLSECQALGIRPQDLVLIREVILKGNNRPWVFARSLLPLSSLTGELRHLRKQRNRPLGAFLFSQPHLTRSPITLAAIKSNHRYVPEDLTGSDLLWGRRSIFSLKGNPLLVSEVFLPDFVASLPTQRA